MRIIPPKTLTGNPDLVNSGLDHPPENPLKLFQRWLDMADQVSISEPRGFVLSTVDISGNLSSRVIFLKELDKTGVIFSSSEVSQKGLDLSQNNRAAGTLWWRETMQQINFGGVTTKLPFEVSDEIFAERPRTAQAVASLSHQSAPMIDEKALRAGAVALIDRPGEIMRPNTWHAYHIALRTIEFWHGRQDRFHNRLRYDLRNGVWERQRL